MDQILKAVEILKGGGVVGIPTETVYGLAADVKSPAGIDLIFKTKKRPFFDPLIVHIGHMVHMKSLVSKFPDLADFLCEKFWPGPLTVVLPKHPSLNPKITSGLPHVGVRFPKHPITQKLIMTLQSPLAAPSANLFGKTSPTKAEHVKKEFPELFVLDGGDSEVGIESTVVGFDDHFTQVRIYRPGAITKETIQEAFDKFFPKKVVVGYAPSPAAPGQLEHHYMPEIPFVLFKSKKMDETVENEIQDKLKLRVLKSVELVLSQIPELAAREMYARLRDLSHSGKNVIYFHVQDHMHDGIWTAILDRLEKAATLKY